jgi:tetratricopeptide (TPR) repeat protein
MLIDLKRPDEALQVFTALTQDYPELADPYNNLAVLYASQGQLHNALAALQSALRNDPHHRAALENQGDIYLSLAQQSWAVAQSESKGDDEALVRKLRLAREILPESAPQPVLKRQAPPPPPMPGSPFRRSQGLDSFSNRR